MKLRLFFISTILLTSTYAASVTKIVKELQDKYEDIDNLTAEFLQIDKFKLTGSQTETKGKIYVKGGVKYRLETMVGRPVPTCMAPTTRFIAHTFAGVSACRLGSAETGLS